MTKRATAKTWNVDGWINSPEGYARVWKDGAWTPPPGAGDFSPLDLIWHAVYWGDLIDAAIDGGNVGDLIDRSGNNNHLNQGTATRRPTYVETNAAFDSHSTLRFAGNDADPVNRDYMLSLAFEDLPQPFTVVYVAKNRSLAVADQRLIDGVVTIGTERAVIETNRGGKLQIWAGGTFVDGGPATTDIHVVVITFNGTASRIRVDGVDRYTGSVDVGPAVLTQLRVGQSGGVGAAAYDGDLAFLGFYAGIMASHQVGLLESYLIDYYNIGGGPDTPPATPTGLAATPSDGLVVLDWDDNGEGDFNHYDYRVNGGAPVNAGATSDAIVAGLTNGVTYTFEVRAVDANGNQSGWSTPVSSTPSGVFDPLTQLSPQHVVWLNDPSWTAPVDGTAITTFRNGSGGGNPAATGTGKPIYHAADTDFNGHRSAAFDGVDDVAGVDITNVNAPYKVLLVCKWDATTVSRSVVGFGNSTAGGINVNGLGYWQIASTTALSSSTPIDTDTHLLRATIDAGGSEVWLDETSIAAGVAGSTALSWLRLGAAGTSGSPGRYGHCRIAFYAIYDGATSDAALGALAARLMTYYGITP